MPQPVPLSEIIELWDTEMFAEDSLILGEQKVSILDRLAARKVAEIAESTDLRNGCGA